MIVMVELKEFVLQVIGIFLWNNIDIHSGQNLYMNGWI